MRKEEARRRRQNKERKRKVGVRKKVDCGPSPVWPPLPFSSTLGVLATQPPVPSLPLGCCWTTSQVPRSGGAWLSVRTRLTLNKFHYTLYKKARSIPHLANQPLGKRKPLGPLCMGTSVGRRGRGVTQFPNGLLCPCIKPSWPLGASVGPPAGPAGRRRAWPGAAVLPLSPGGQPLASTALSPLCPAAA